MKLAFFPILQVKLVSESEQFLSLFTIPDINDEIGTCPFNNACKNAMVSHHLNQLMNRIMMIHYRKGICPMTMIVEPYRLPVQILSVPVTSPTVNLYYPQVTGLRDIRIQQHMNQVIYRQFHSIIKQQGYYENPDQTEMTGIYEIKTNERGILSLTQNNYTYIYMHANGLTIIKSLTFDTRTGKSYTLKELFKPNSDYVKKISTLIEQQIRQRQINLTSNFTVIRPDQDYYIADKSLVVYFQMYEITPRPYGLPMFPISVYELQDLIDEEGPLGKMILD
jgi:hypothetical protein